MNTNTPTPLTPDQRREFRAVFGVIRKGKGNQREGNENETEQDINAGHAPQKDGTKQRVIPVRNESSGWKANVWPRMLPDGIGESKQQVIRG